MKTRLIKYEQIMNAPPLVCILTAARTDCPSRAEELALAREGLPAMGIPCLTEPLSGERESEQLRRQTERCRAAAEREGTGLLLLTDSGEALRRIKELGLAAAGYRHEGNRSEDFTGAEFLVEEPQEVDGDSWTKIYQRLVGRPWTIALTDRLWIREMVPEDLEALYSLYADPQARRYLTPPEEDRAREAERLGAYIRTVYRLCGYGMWAVCSRESGEVIGRVGFSPHEGRNGVAELGYLIRSDLRGQRLGTEAVAAALRFAKEEAGFSLAGAHTDAENAASIALLRRMRFTEVDDSGTSGILYFERKL